MGRNISGFREVYEHATEEVYFENQYKFRVASLAGNCHIKMIAWDDRPEIRIDDIADVATIIRNYFQLEETLIFEKYADLFTLELKDLQVLAARALGRGMGWVLQRNELLKIVY